jgi:hypothetical protein
MKNGSIVLATLFAIGTLAAGSSMAADIKVKLSGDNEVPPVKTTATGEGTISIGDDGSVSGSITTKGIDGTMGHIHFAGAGKNGPVIVKLTKDGDVYKVPADAHLDSAQLAAFKAGELYVNVHSAANKAGEIRAQLK